MTLNEFKAWFEGFSEIMEGPPNDDQWKRIKARVDEIDGAPTNYPVFVDRYVTPYRRYYDGPIWSGGAMGVGASVLLGHNGTSPKLNSTSFNPLDAMTAAGRAEYNEALAAAHV